MRHVHRSCVPGERSAAGSSAGGKCARRENSIAAKVVEGDLFLLVGPGCERQVRVRCSSLGVGATREENSLFVFHGVDIMESDHARIQNRRCYDRR